MTSLSTRLWFKIFGKLITRESVSGAYKSLNLIPVLAKLTDSLHKFFFFDIIPMSGWKVHYYTSWVLFRLLILFLDFDFRILILLPNFNFSLAFLRLIVFSLLKIDVFEVSKLLLHLFELAADIIRQVDTAKQFLLFRLSKQAHRKHSDFDFDFLESFFTVLRSSLTSLAKQPSKLSRDV